MLLKILVKIVIGCLTFLVFSGCASKATFYKEECPLEKPSRTVIVTVCGSLDSYKDKMECLINKYEALVSDFSLQEAYIQECIR